ncbi:MAG: dipeptidase [Vicinamibacterales bacterium]
MPRPLNRTLLASATLAALVAVALPVRPSGQATDALLQRAAAIMSRAPLIDGHNDLPWEMRVRVAYDASKLDIRQSQPALETDIPRLRAGHVGGQFWSVYVPASMSGQKAVVATLEQIAFVHEMARRYPDTFELASTAADIRRSFKSGKIASLSGVEGGHSIDSSLATLRMLYALGARYMTLTHNSNTPWADAANDKPEHNGLTPFGETVVREMNWLGMIVDLSHVAPQTMARALDVTEAPVMFSHSSAKAICGVPRNVPDDILARLPKNGGVVMVNFYNGFVPPDCLVQNKNAADAAQRFRLQFQGDPKAAQAAIDKWTAENPSHSTLSQVADHVDYIRKVAGIDHIGIGSDFDGIDGEAPAGLEDVSKYPALVAELLRRGYSDSDIEKFIGGNILRVLEQTEQVAARLQKQRGPSTATLAPLPRE